MEQVFSGYQNIPQVIPQWATVHLGKKVVLLKNYDAYGNGKCIYEAGTIGVLNGIQQGIDGAEALILAPDDQSYILNPTFDYIAPT